MIEELVVIKITVGHVHFVAISAALVPYTRLNAVTIEQSAI
jgi:hypothetical protein